MKPSPELMVEAAMAASKRFPWLGREFDRIKIVAETSLMVRGEPQVACMDGSTLRFDPKRFAEFSPEHRLFIAVHEAGHKFLRHADRFNQPHFADPARANAAADYAMNGYFIGKGLDAPPDCLYDPKYEGMCAEDIYDRLPASPRSPSWGNFGDKPDNKPADEAQKQLDAKGDPGVEEMISRELGIEPASSDVPLQKILERLLILDPVWSRSFRRQNRVCEDFPAWHEIDEKPRVVVGLDVSGSIDATVRQVFLGVFAKVLTPVAVIAVDTSLKGEWLDVCASNCAKLQAEMPQHGGGTRFQPAIDYAAEHQASLVYLTDGECHERLNGRGVPITWLVWGDGGVEATMRPVGRIIKVQS